MKEIIVAIVSLLVGYFVSKLQSRYTERRQRIQERFEKLYAPFEKLIWCETHGAFEFSNLDPKLQKQFMDLLFNNYEYADSMLKELLMRFKWTYDNLDMCKEEADEHFFMIENRITKVFNVLSKKLFLDPAYMRYSKKNNKEWNGFFNNLEN